ncbi:hypothetical protein BACCIP111895_00192 [Neobacillus rhizosphaerae]|uniref:Lipoprotein n=1 Tax=Neobacillus rhizosphaerae TaxID=2880965 RepID=A0ABM9ELN8_9BACI|nr:hypothetical protein [Neobacillus rhizosphaerae]CAH2713059.1 hypothetical protein BACCIP111895_00192 [Neobacillus rhizosphaerae]
MQKMVWSMIASLILLAACQNSEPKKNEVKQTPEKLKQTVEQKTDSTFPYPNLLAENAQSYSLLVIGEEDDKTPIEKDQKIIKNVKNILSLPTKEMAQKVYPKLSVKSKSAYILFDNNGVVYQSKNLNELTRFLQENPAK